MTPQLCEVLRPVVGRLPFGRVRVLRMLGADRIDRARWEKAGPIRVFYDPDLEAYVSANLADWTGRWHYFTRRYPDPEVRKAINQLLCRGDTFIDIGANKGIYSILASKIVGKTGKVISLEPNRHMYDLVNGYIAINDLGNIETRNVALGDENTTALLRNTDELHTGTASLRYGEKSDAEVINEVEVVRGDDIINVGNKTNLFIKVDVEGFEYRVLRGLDRTLSEVDCIVLVEVTDKWLRDDDASAKKLYGYMRAKNYSPYAIGSKAFGGVELIRLESISHISDQHNVVFQKESVYER